ncbi:uncharacterized protein LOC128551100 [Mercenaria mercenaria]|uniref:uncharacterized protein LOC128551100 n=1 Tax=Mercenaria mercenaria TaxID=6596 RepID=UPI00234F03C5|nr:uncharacterized protein LOC128551100 [Mercenaria mercenaria]
MDGYYFHDLALSYGHVLPFLAFLAIIIIIIIILLLIAFAFISILLPFAVLFNIGRDNEAIIIVLDIYKGMWNGFKVIWKCLAFNIGKEKCIQERHVCDVCKVQHEDVLRYCYVCEQYICYECYTIHQRFNSCRNHKTSRGKCVRLDEIPLSRQNLVEDSLKCIRNTRLGYPSRASIFKDARTLRYCAIKIRSFYKFLRGSSLQRKCVETRAFIINQEGGKPIYILEKVIDIPNFTADDVHIVPVFNADSGFLFIIYSTNVIYFIKSYVPYLAKFLNFSKIISCNYADITYHLRACSAPFKTITIENVHQDVLCTEFKNEIAVLGLENNKKFGLVPVWSMNYFSHEGKFLHKCYLKNSNKGIFLQSPVYMRATFNNTIVICDSVQTDKYVNEFDMEGNLVLQVNLEEELSGTITGVTSDDENNIYVSSELEVVQISENGRKVRQLLTIAEHQTYDCILDICFSAKKHKIHVAMRENYDDTITVVAFRFIAY